MSYCNARRPRYIEVCIEDILRGKLQTMWALPHTDICQCYRLMVRHTFTLPIHAADKVYQVAQVASIRVLQDHFGIILDARSEVSTSPTLANGHNDNNIV